MLKLKKEEWLIIGSTLITILMIIAVSTSYRMDRHELINDRNDQLAILNEQAIEQDDDAFKITPFIFEGEEYNPSESTN